jgi:hypothetical protein
MPTRCPESVTVVALALLLALGGCDGNDDKPHVHTITVSGSGTNGTVQLDWATMESQEVQTFRALGWMRVHPV